MQQKKGQNTPTKHHQHYDSGFVHDKIQTPCMSMKHKKLLLLIPQNRSFWLLQLSPVLPPCLTLIGTEINTLHLHCLQYKQSIINGIHILTNICIGLIIAPLGYKVTPCCYLEWQTLRFMCLVQQMSQNDKFEWTDSSKCLLHQHTCPT